MPEHRVSEYAYNTEFFDYIERGALRSARAVVPLIIKALDCKSVLDVGCGAGAWLSVYRSLGVSDLLGVDGDYVDTSRLLVPKDHFRAEDVSRDFDLRREFELAQSLEVAEHLPPDSSRSFIANLVRHAPRVLFSAAPPGQGGEHHVNERPYEFWRALFAEHGYVPFDFLRPLIRPEHEVEPWYAYNTILYVRGDSVPNLPREVQHSRVPDTARIANVATVGFQLRRLLLRPLPVSIVSALAVLNRRLNATIRSSRQ